MKKIYSILSIAVAFSMLAVTSCSDDDGEDINRTEVLTSKKWTILKIEAGMANEYEDITDAQLYECERDDIETYSTDNIYTKSPGEDNCDGDATGYTGTWAWKDGEKILTTTTFGDTEDYIVESMSASQLKLKSEDKDISVEVGGTTYYYTVIVTYTGK
jgi:hypothetical protein